LTKDDEQDNRPNNEEKPTEEKEPEEEYGADGIDWEAKYRPSESYQTERIKSLLKRLREMKPYLDEEENEINEEYLILRLRVDHEIREIETASAS
jgi:hypothetical protein